MYTSTDLVVHRSRFYVPELYSINCIAYNEKHSKVALLRRRIRKYQPSQNEMLSIIEIWNMQNKASFIEQVIIDDPDNLTLLEDVAWSTSGRLFSCGLNTYINEYDLENGRIKQSYCANSSPAWCLSIDKNDQLVATGTEDGYICIYNIFDTCFQYEKILDRNDSRILCLEWFYPNSGSPLLVAGSIDYIKIWNLESGRCADFIKVGNTGVVVWCLKVLKDFTIVSGDSTGTTSFWNGTNTTLNSAFKAHKGDVLSVCVSTDERNVYSAGVDPAIIQFVRNSSKTDAWITSIHRRPHSHDVRSLVYTKTNWLLSGGVDSAFVQSFQSSNLDVRHLSNYANKMGAISTPKGNYVCLQSEKFIQIWKLGIAENEWPDRPVNTPNSENVTPLKIVDNAVKLLEISSRKAIAAFAFNAEWLIYANYGNLRVIAWTEESIEKVKLLHDNPITNVSNICITDDNRFAITHGRSLETFKLDKFGVLAENNIRLKGRVHKIVTAGNKLIVSVADKNNSIIIYETSTLKQLKSFSNELLPCTMKMNNTEHNARLWLAYANATLTEYDLASFAIARSYSLSQFKSNENRECQDFNEHWPIKQIAFSKHTVLFSNDHNLYCLQQQKNRIIKSDKYRHILRLDNLSQNELALVEATPEMLLNMLPSTLKTKSFGT